MRPMRIIEICLILAFVALAPRPLPAQDDPNLDIGMKAFGSYEMGNIDNVSLSNGSLAVDIPLISYPQRGGRLTLDFGLHYFSPAYYTSYVCYHTYCGWVPFYPGGGMGVVDKQEVATTYTETNGSSPNYMSLIESDGSTHPLAATGNNLLESIDASGYQATGGGAIYPFNSVTNMQGITYTPVEASECYVGFVGFSVVDPSYSYSTLPRVCAGSRSDPNGNQISYPLTYPEPGWTDTMGRAIPLPTKSTNQSDFSGCTGPEPILFVLLWNPPGVNGGTYPLKFCYFSENTKATYGFDQYELQSVVLPDNTAWTFQYTPYGSVYPVLSQITFPTGGTLAYTWITSSPCSPPRSYQVDYTYAVVTRTLNPNDGVTPSSTWSYSYSQYPTYPIQTIVSAPPSSGSTPDDTVHTIGLGTSAQCFLYETKAQSYQGSHTNGSLLKTTSTTYQYSTTTCSSANICNLVPQTVTDAWANGETNEVSSTYDRRFKFYEFLGLYEGSPMSTSGSGSLYAGTYGLELTKQEYDYGSGGPGSLLRTTTTNYLALNNSTYLNANLLNLPSSVQVSGSGPGSLTDYGYDAAGGVHGNLTSTSRWLNTTSGYLTTTNVYDSYGRVTSTTDPKNNTTTYGYGSCYAGSGPTSVTNALNQTASSCYDANTGLLTTTTDPNSQTTTYTYDNMLRTTQITYPKQTLADGAQLNGVTTFSYPTTTEAQISELMDDQSHYRKSTLLVDGIGREIRQAVTNSESEPYDEVDTCYNGNGRVSFKSYPFQDSGPFSTPRTCSSSETGDSFAYDALKRTTSVTHSPDSSSVLTSYTGRATSVQDEGNGTQRVQRVSQVDGLGRLTSVCEVTSTTLTVGISGSTTPAACGQDIAATGFLTTYAYDALDNLTSVTQGPLNARSFLYDSLSRLTSSTNPESVATTYTYDADGNVSTKVDARGITTCFGTWTGTTCNATTGYDSINRLLKKTYSDGTPAASFIYDSVSISGVATPTNAVGRLVEESTSNTASVFSYDPMGRAVWNAQCTPLNCGTGWTALYYAYDLLGDMTSSTNGAGVTLTSAYNAGGRLTSIASSLSDAQHPALLWGNPVHYNAAGGLISATYGNGIIETRNYDARQRLTGVTDGSVYTLTIPNGGYAPNSDVLAANDTVNSNWTYAYDAFNRLIAANATGQAYTYAYDRFGNRWQQNGPHPYQASFGANNRITSGTGVAYDAAGDTTNDGTTTYTYDAEGRVTTAYNATSGNSTYIYDAEGRRVQKTTAAGGTVNFLYDLGGHEITQISSTGAWTRGEVYAGGRHVATYTGTGGTTYFIHSDWLGTERLRSAVNGTSAETCTSLPFGDWLTCAGSDSSPMHFTGKERDSESNLDNFGARYDSSSMGRFMSPDPDNAGTYEYDPQTWNAYSYVRNNPLTFTDPDGLDCAYLNNAGNGIESVDTNSSARECTSTGGYWVSGQVNQVTVNDNGTYGFGYSGVGANGALQSITYNSYLAPNSPPREPGLSDDPIIFPAALGLVIGGVESGFRAGSSLLGDLFGTGTRAAVGTAAKSGGEELVAAGTKAAVRGAIDDAALNDTQKAAVKQVLSHARGGQDVIVQKLADGSVRVIRTTLGGGGGRAEYVTDIAADGTRQTVQYGYNAAGDLVHVDPK